MDLNTFVNFVPIVALYAELHYKFPFIKSRYYIDEPEIITDIPHRIDPGRQIPILLMIKEGNKFPVYIKEIKINYYCKEQRTDIQTVSHSLNKHIDSYLWYKNIFLEPMSPGEYLFEINILYSINSKNKNCVNNNTPLLEKKPHRVYCSSDRFPKMDGYIYGDLHYHSILTDDMVEYGAPLDSTVIASEASGLDFVCNTDHSYDLDIKEGSWFEDDLKLEKWYNSRANIKKINSEHDSKILPSEEVSIHNHRKRNIHALVLNNHSFLEGKGDGARTYFNRKCKYNTKSLYQNKESGSIVIAAHPFVKVSLMEWIFIKRGKWEWNDIIHDGLSGLQILNGPYDKSFFDGLEIWKKLLLNGYKKFIYAGNDAHGNFNMYRQIKIPMFSLSQKYHQILGQSRTGIYSTNNTKNVVQALKSGRCFITNGPFIENIITDDGGCDYFSGQELHGTNSTITIKVLSSIEFGKIDFVKIYAGSTKIRSEKIIYNFTDINSYKFERILKLEGYESTYIRSECKVKSEKIIRAYTNPTWIS